MTPSTDTIAALATPVGTAAIAVLRASGPGCRELAEALLGPGKTLKPRRAHHTDYKDRNGVTVDDVVVTFFAGPKSYTGEDSLEISCHGNPLIAQRILEDLLQRGFRAAEPGEFTRRAFVNGRLDLSQAEAVIDLIHARSERALVVANQQLRGSLGRHLNPLIEKLLETLARIEAYIDFPEEDLPAEDRSLVATLIGELSQGTDRLLATRHYGDLLREGIRTVMLGEPNAGKSSLLNRLVGSERALVSPEPGTTRDFIEERLMLGSHCLRLIDTAGLNPTPAPVEKLGIQKTLERAAEADLFLLVLDASRPHPTLPAEVSARLSAENAIIVLNKIDLTARAVNQQAIEGKEFIEVSALTGEGIQNLEAAILRRAEAFRKDTGEDVIAINARHSDSLGRAKASLLSALDGLKGQLPIELISSDLREALSAFGEIGGRIDNERMLDHLFSTFCIGK